MPNNTRSLYASVLLILAYAGVRWPLCPAFTSRYLSQAESEIDVTKKCNRPINYIDYFPLFIFNYSDVSYQMWCNARQHCHNRDFQVLKNSAKLM